MVKETDEELMNVFRIEAQDLISSMREELSLFSNDLALAYDGNRIKELSRYAHTLKGSSDSAGITKINKIAAFLSDIFRDGKDGKTKMTLDSIHILMQAVEVCQKLLNGQDFEGYNELVGELEKI